MTGTTANTQWPHEPADFQVITDWGFDQAPPQTPADQTIPRSPGWNVAYNNLHAPAGVSLVSDPTAPFTPPNVYQFFYPIGYAAGAAPATVYTTKMGSPAPTALYVGFWWKVSNPWQGHPASGVNKVIFIWTGPGTSSIIFMLNGTSPPYMTRIEYESAALNAPENQPSLSAIRPGVWHQVEILADLPAKTLEWWVDGVLRGSYSNCAYRYRTFAEVSLSPTWGGVGGRKAENDYFWYDHIHVSGF